jgi:hypothetical protein
VISIFLGMVYTGWAPACRQPGYYKGRALFVDFYFKINKLMNIVISGVAILCSLGATTQKELHQYFNH